MQPSCSGTPAVKWRSSPSIRKGGERKTMVLLSVLLPLLLVTGAQNRDLLVSAGWLRANQKNPRLVVLHVARDRADYDRGHIPEARFVQASTLWTSAGPGVELPTIAYLDSLFESAGVLLRLPDHSLRRSLDHPSGLPGPRLSGPRRPIGDPRWRAAGLEGARQRRDHRSPGRDGGDHRTEAP